MHERYEERKGVEERGKGLEENKLKGKRGGEVGNDRVRITWKGREGEEKDEKIKMEEDREREIRVGGGIEGRG